MKTKKLDKSVSRHFAELKVFYKKLLTKSLEQHNFRGTENKTYVQSYIFVFNLSPYKWKTDLIGKPLISISNEVKQHALNFSIKAKILWKL